MKETIINSTKIITIKWLTDNKACQEGIDFFRRNFGEQLDLNTVESISGDYNNFAKWLNCNLKNELFYNNKGNLVKIIHQSGKTIFYKYDKRGNLVKKIWPSGEMWSYKYDKRGNLVKKVWLSGETWYYEYDDHKNLVKEVRPNNEIWSYEYDNNNNRVKEIYSDGMTYSFEYDKRGNKVKEVWPSGETCFYSFNFDNEGRLIQAGDLKIKYKCN